MGQLKETAERLKEETPDYHKKNRKYGIGLAGLGLALKVAVTVFPATMPIGLASLGWDLVLLGLGVAGYTYTTSTTRNGRK